MSIHEAMKGKVCPHCKLTFGLSFWQPGSPIPDEKEMQNPDGVLLIVCSGCRYILAMFPASGDLMVAPPGLLDEVAQVSPAILDGLRKTQRLLWYAKMRAAAQEIAKQN